MSSNKLIDLDQRDQRSALEREAAEWFTLMQADYVDDQTLKAFDNWLAASAEHREAYLETELLGDS